jgi:HemY protein
MIRLVLFLLAILAVVAGLHWLADRPGNILIEWQGYIIETSVFRAFIIVTAGIGVLAAIWSLLRQLWFSPATLGRLLHHRRQKRGLDALSSGIIAVGAGDPALASRYASQARKALPNEPLTHLLRAQTAQLTGDKVTARRIFEAMLASPDTEQLGLRGLFLEAQREGEQMAARQFAQRAVALNPKLGWPVEALFDLHCRFSDWQGALDSLAIAQRHGLIDKPAANRRRAVLLTAQAQIAEDGAAPTALDLALEAHRLAPDLVPAAAIAGRILASQGNTPRAARVLLKTWRLAPHPELAAAYAHARPGDSPRDRLNRVRHLGRLMPHDAEGPIALAISAIEAREWDEARRALEPLTGDRLTQRVCTLMARIEAEQQGRTGHVREWLARAVNALRDPAWTADGVVRDRWAPVSPVTGVLDAFRWRVPVEAMDEPVGALLHAKVEALVGLGASSETLLEHQTPQAPPLAAVTVTAAHDTATTPAGLPIEAAAEEAPPAATPSAVITEKRETGTPAIEPAPLPARSEPTVPPTRTEPPAHPRPREDVAAAASRPAQRPMPTHRAVEPKIFVPPRAPDDPGPEESDGLEVGSFRPSEAKA